MFSHRCDFYWHIYHCYYLCFGEFSCKSNYELFFHSFNTYFPLCSKKKNYWLFFIIFKGISKIFFPAWNWSYFSITKCQERNFLHSPNARKLLTRLQGIIKLDFVTFLALEVRAFPKCPKMVSFHAFENLVIFKWYSSSPFQMISFVMYRKKCS